MSDFQGILLDEADGVNRSQQPVMPAGFQPPKVVVSSWNRKVINLSAITLQMPVSALGRIQEETICARPGSRFLNLTHTQKKVF